MFALGAIVAAATDCSVRRASIEAPGGPRHETIRAIKRVEREAGFAETANFERVSATRDAYYRCYYTGKFELPDSYEGLRVKDGNANGCDLDEERYDVFFYKIEAVADSNTPVTSSLEEASVERLAVVVSHEDFHEDPLVQRLPVRVGEAATTLVGFLVATRFATQEYGPESDTAVNLAREAGLYRRKAKIVNAYHERVADLYKEYRRRRIGRAEAQERKNALFGQMQTECEAIQPDPVSFNKCLAANNNAGLAFEITYTRFFPLLEELHRSLGGNIKATIGVLRAAGELSPISESAAEKYLRSGRGVKAGADPAGS